MWDPVSKLLTELRDNAAVAAIVSANPTTSVPRVRSPKPAPGDAQGPGSATEPAAYRAFIVLATLATPRFPRVPVQRARHVVRCYGRNPIEADRLYRAASDELHGKGPRQTGGGDGIYVSHDDTGAAYGEDPVTKQPFYEFVVETLATTQAVAP